MIYVKKEGGIMHEFDKVKVIAYWDENLTIQVSEENKRRDFKSPQEQYFESFQGVVNEL